VKVTGTSARVLVGCSGGPGATCKVTVTLTVTETLRGGRLVAVSAEKKRTKAKKKTVTLASATMTLTAGQIRMVRITLDRTGKRLLSQDHVLKVKLTILQSGKVVSVRTITFKAERNRGQHKH
jgi:hypothetical protein